jgi:hypothetical protein
MAYLDSSGLTLHAPLMKIDAIKLEGWMILRGSLKHLRSSTYRIHTITDQGQGRSALY